MTKKTAKPQQAAQIGAGSDDAGGMGDDIASAVRIRPLADLVPYVRNARTHDDAQVAQIMGSILEFGFTNPVLADAKGIVAGHGRVMAAAKLYDSGRVIRLPSGRELPKGTVPVLDCTGWSDAQRRAYILADNRLALNAGWNYEMLAVELDELRDMEFDLGLLGFDKQELNDLIGTPNEGPSHVEGEDDAPEPPDNPVTKSGDVWLLGKHRLMCGDSTDAGSVALLMGGGMADLLVSDPPYGIGYEYAEHDDSSNEENAKLVADAFAHGPAVKVWTPGLHNLARDISRFGMAKVLVWFKKFAAAGNGLGGASVWEPVLVVGRPKVTKLPTDVIEKMTDREQVGGVDLRKLHTCPKPVGLYTALIEAFSAPGDSLYEPFSGSGTTIIAAEQTGRRCYAMEISPQYVDVAVRRWQEFTGKDATLDGDGRTFGEIADERIGATA